MTSNNFWLDAFIIKAYYHCHKFLDPLTLDRDIIFGRPLSNKQQITSKWNANKFRKHFALTYDVINGWRLIHVPTT